MDALDIPTGIPYGRPPKLSEGEDCKDFPTTDIGSSLEKSINLPVTNDWKKPIACIVNQIHSHDSFQTSDPGQEFLTLIKSKVEDCKDVPTTDNCVFLEKVMNLPVNYWQEQLSDFPLEQQLDRPSDRLFNMIHHVMKKMDRKELAAALKGLSGTDCRFIHCGEQLAGTSLSRPPAPEGGWVPNSIGLANNNGDPSSCLKHSPPGKENAGRFVNVSGDAIGSMNAPRREGDVEMALGDVPSSIVPHVAHTADQSSWALKAAVTGFSAAASRTPTTSMVAMPPTVIGVVCNVFAILLADTNKKAATTILAKIGILACAVGVLADMGKALPLALFTVAMIAAVAIIIVVMVFPKHRA